MIYHRVENELKAKESQNKKSPKPGKSLGLKIL
jgi:hypothetical protein